MNLQESGLNPILGRGGSGGAEGAISSWIASKTRRNCSSYLDSRSSRRRASSTCDASNARSLTNARMISMLTCMARLLRRTLESMATPCSVKAYGRYLMFWPRFKITDCDLEVCFAFSAEQRGIARPASSQESWNMKSSGNLSALRRTACTSTRGFTSYNRAKSWLSMTLWPRIRYIRLSTSGLRSIGFGVSIPIYTHDPLIWFPQNENAPQNVLKRVTKWRRGRDSNPRAGVSRLPVFKTGSLNRSDTPPTT